jgi:hypothetical protein
LSSKVFSSKVVEIGVGKKIRFRGTAIQPKYVRHSSDPSSL